MALSGYGTFLQIQKSRHHVSIPQAVVQDSKFPLLAGERVRVVIDPKNRRIILEPTQAAHRN